MATAQLIERLLDETEDGTAVMEALRILLDDATLEPDAEPLSVADTASLTRLSPHTLRYYEREGLVRPARTESGYREYSAIDLRRLVFLTRMRASGMTMSDLKRYVALIPGGRSTQAERRTIMVEQRERIRHQLRELRLALEATEFKIRVYGGHPED
jgi:DNA-binding transcriptional MerR regulator